ncbi:hypothetical protein BJX99DRAFT_257650 [Aspergillus californicus]
MRFDSKHVAFLAIILGVLLQVAARAVPSQIQEIATLAPRVIITPPKVPLPHAPVAGTASSPGGIHAPEPIKPNSNPEPKPNTGPKPNPDPKANSSPACKRAPGVPCTTTSTSLDDPTFFTAANMGKSRDGKTAYGFVNWQPPVAELRTMRGQLAFRRSIRSLAKRVYEGLWRDNGVTIQNPGTNLVAALHVPGKGVYLSTIPRGDRAVAIIADWEHVAPKLNHAAGFRDSTQDGPNRLHAEDGAIYHCEFLTKESGQTIPGSTFPGHTSIIVFGKRTTADDGHAHVVPPCNDRRNPSRTWPCENALRQLGIHKITNVLPEDEER